MVSFMAHVMKKEIISQHQNIHKRKDNNSRKMRVLDKEHELSKSHAENVSKFTPQKKVSLLQYHISYNYLA